MGFTVRGGAGRVRAEEPAGQARPGRGVFAGGVVAAALLVAGLSLSPLRTLADLPYNLRLAEGTQHELAKRLAFPLYLRSDRDGLFRINRDLLSRHRWVRRSQRHLAIQPLATGRHELEVGIFRVFPVRRVTVEVVPAVRVVASGHTVGVIIEPDGVVVAGPEPVVTAGAAFSPAERAGLRPGDTILAVDGRPVAGVRAGRPGVPKEKVGVFLEPRQVLGRVERNTVYRLFGRLDEIPPWQGPGPLPVAAASQVHPGPAVMWTVVRGEVPEPFQIEIERVYPADREDEKGMVVRVRDQRPLFQAGGIVQGMSGSPIIQAGRLVGAVTHVFVHDPSRGYAVFAYRMPRDMLQGAGTEAPWPPARTPRRL